MHTDAKIHEDFEQGSPEWHDARRGLMTASEMNLVLTPTLKLADNEKLRLHVYEMAAQRITGYTEPTYVGDNMLRGHADEIKARDLFSEKVEPLGQVGFVTRNFGAYTLGYSPDGVGLLGNFGMEAKSRIQKHQLKTIVDNEVPTEHKLQLQTGLAVTGWDYIEYISYSAGMPMCVIHVDPDPVYQSAIHEAALNFEVKVQTAMKAYRDRLGTSRLFETERDEEEQEIYIG